MKVDIRRLGFPLRTALEAAHGRVERRELVLLTLQAEDGQTGWGEAAPLESYDGVSVEQVLEALEDCRSALASADGRAQADVLADCWRMAALPQAVAAVDLALWDLAGRRTGQPVWRLLGASAAAPLAVNCTLTSSDRAGASREAAEARAEGFACLKAKVGIGDDAGRLAAIRAAGGPGMAIRLDANAAWSVAEAQAALRILEPVGIELCEEPVRTLEETAELAGLTTVPLALDESAAAPGALERRACSAVGLKLSRWGGITGLMQAAQRARATGYEVYLTSTLDGPLGIAAALHAAAAIAPDRPCGLATLSLFDHGPNPLAALQGCITVPPGPGLGDGLTPWYEP